MIIWRVKLYRKLKFRQTLALSTYYSSEFPGRARIANWSTSSWGGNTSSIFWGSWDEEFWWASATRIWRCSFPSATPLPGTCPFQFIAYCDRWYSGWICFWGCSFSFAWSYHRWYTFAGTSTQFSATSRKINCLVLLSLFLFSIFITACPRWDCGWNLFFVLRLTYRSRRDCCSGAHCKSDFFFFGVWHWRSSCLQDGGRSCTRKWKELFVFYLYKICSFLWFIFCFAGFAPPAPLSAIPLSRFHFRKLCID